jgi:hypothetical protein
MFDPNELSRRLEAHLVGLKLEREWQRRNSDVEKSGYRHVPRVAAADFSRTATPEGMSRTEAGKKHVHKLGRKALKQHVDGVNVDASGSASFGVRRTLAIDKARAQREILGDRNQFQRNKDLEDAAQSDKERNIFRAPQRTFASDHLYLHQNVATIQPLSIGELNWDDPCDVRDSSFARRAKSRGQLLPTPKDRQDWAQRDEATENHHRSVKDRVGPILRASESIWALRSKKDHVNPESPRISANTVSSPDSKQKKGSFLARFRREARISE